MSAHSFPASKLSACQKPGRNNTGRWKQRKPRRIKSDLCRNGNIWSHVHKRRCLSTLFFFFQMTYLCIHYFVIGVRLLIQITECQKKSSDLFEQKPTVHTIWSALCWLEKTIFAKRQRRPQCLNLNLDVLLSRQNAGWKQSFFFSFLCVIVSFEELLQAQIWPTFWFTFSSLAGCWDITRQDLNIASADVCMGSRWVECGFSIFCSFRPDCVGKINKNRKT